MLVRAKSSKKKVSTVVQFEEIAGFQRKLKDIQSQSTKQSLKGVRRKEKEERKQTERAQEQKPNRRERRKVLKKQKKKELKARLKREAQPQDLEL